MTVKELYEYAKENGFENVEIKLEWNYDGCMTGTNDLDKDLIDFYECTINKEVIILVDCY